MNFLLDIIDVIDYSLLQALSLPFRGEISNKFWQFITMLGDWGMIWIVLGIVLLCFVDTRRCGLGILIALILSLVVCNLFLKELVLRPRPFVTHPEFTALIVPPDRWSFPSGHATASFAAVGALLCFYKLWGLVAVVPALAICYSRLFLGVHYPSDVLCGILIGLLLGWIGAAFAKILIDTFYSIRLRGMV